MKAEASQQRSLAELAEIDVALARIDHRQSHLAEQLRCEELQVQHRSADDRLAALQLVVDDLDAQVSRFEAEIDAVRQREDRDRSMLAAGAINAKQLADLQHELETLQRRQASLEDSLLEVMERREELHVEHKQVLADIDALRSDLAAAQQARDTVVGEMDRTRAEHAQRRAELGASVDPGLVALYERQRSSGGVGAGPLQGRRCGACRIEIDKGEMARISAADDDEVLRCPECGAILLRDKGSDR